MITRFTVQRKWPLRYYEVKVDQRVAACGYVFTRGQAIRRVLQALQAIRLLDS